MLSHLMAYCSHLLCVKKYILTLPCNSYFRCGKAIFKFNHYLLYSEHNKILNKAFDQKKRKISMTMKMGSKKEYVIMEQPSLLKG